MPYASPIYRTLVRMSDGGGMGRSNLAPQPGGFLRGLPSPFWCTSSFTWQIFVYYQDGEPADFEGGSATLYARRLNTIEADMTLSQGQIIEGDPGCYNCVVFDVSRDSVAENTYSGEQMLVYADISVDADSVSIATDGKVTVYQPLEFIGASGDQSATSYAPVPAGRWMGTYSGTTVYMPYDTVVGADEDGVDCVWMNIAAAGSTGVTPSNANATTWYCIVRDYTGAYLQTLSGTLTDHGDRITALEADSNVITSVAGTTVALQPYALTAGGWVLADADLHYDNLIGIALGTDAETDGIRVHGLVTNPAWTWTAGKAVYLDVTAGALTQTQPDAALRVLGFAVSATSLWLNGATMWDDTLLSV